jgi:catechol 2,3-dioxygenase-like lactoylglutathione lyase family enzyme
MKTALLGVLMAPLLLAQNTGAPKPPRPRIFGIAHYAIKVADLQKARAYYKDFLGFDEPFSLKNADGSVSMAFIKVNDYQYIEVSPGLKPREDRLSHLSFFTDDAEAMRVYLGASGIKVPDQVPKGRSGNLNFTVKDPDGHGVEIVQYLPDGWALQNKGRFLPDTRISQHIAHVGILVGDANAAKQFYGEILGFQETWRGSAAGSSTVSWINMRVPNGTDYVEFMLFKDEPATDRRGTEHHICLETPSIPHSLERLKAREYSVTYGRPLEIRTGINRKRQLNLYDPDGTRAELMEPVTVDGSAPPPTSAPLPRP